MGTDARRRGLVRRMAGGDARAHQATPDAIPDNMSATSQGEAHARSPDRSRRNRNRARGGLEGLREQIVPAISQLSGFQSGTWLTGNESSSVLSLTVLDTEANAQVMAERFCRRRVKTGVLVNERG